MLREFSIQPPGSEQPRQLHDGAEAGHAQGTHHPTAAPGSHKHAPDGPLLVQVTQRTELKDSKLDLQRSERRIKSLVARSSI